MQEGVIGAEFERLQLINNYGSKMTKLIGWLKDAIKEDSNNRFILFSKVSPINIQYHLRYLD